MTAKTEDSPQKRLELRFLSDYVHCPEETRQAAAKYMVEDDAFTCDDYRAAWRRLHGCSDADEVARLECVTNALGFKGDARNEFLDLGSLTREPIEEHAHDLAMFHYGRRLGAAARTALSRVDDCVDGESLLQKVNLALGEIPRPPHIGDGNESEYAAKQLQAQSEADIPDELLHRPGFIDEVVEYTLTVAHKPNRTLAFAGALALTAHLMGRRYTDLRDTRSNLFVFALGPTGIGKECPRRVTRRILRECNLSSTVFDTPSSGEAIEETLYRTPCALFQIDEIQKTLQNLKDERNSLALSISRFLMTLYTASGSDHTMRLKATDPQSIGRVIADPSLTLFATGISRDSFKALTPSVIKEGLLGRCLMLDSEIEGELNTFSEGRPEPTKNLIATAQEIAGPGGVFGSGNAPSPTRVPYADGVGERINEINNEIAQRKKACHKRLDEIGEALWARASEKVTKLALISAVSATREKPTIRKEDVEWAWKFVQCLVQRMVHRVDTYMTNGKVEEICQKIIEYLIVKGGTCTRRDLFRAKRLVEGPDFEAAERTLIARGQIVRTETGRNSVVYRLVDQK